MENLPRVYMGPQSMFPVALSLSKVICCILRTSVLLFPSSLFECKEVLTIVVWLLKCLWILINVSAYHVHTP